MNHSPGNPDLIAAILREIRERGPMPFARFMELALYHPRHGYYTTRARIFGRGGDYYTSTDLHPAFGALLARQAEDIWRVLGCPAAFTIAEMGAGRGFLCRDLLAHLREFFADCFSATRYIIDERSPALRAAQMELLSDAGLQSRVAWSQLEDMPETGIEGLFLSNELVDALPVRRARMTGNGLQEQFVDQSGGELRLVWDAPAGKGRIIYAGFAGEFVAAKPQGVDAFLALLEYAAAQRQDMSLQRAGAWQVERAPFRMGRCLSPGLKLTGRFQNLLEPGAPVAEDPEFAAGQNFFLRQLDD